MKFSGNNFIEQGDIICLTSARYLTDISFYVLNRSDIDAKHVFIMNKKYFYDYFKSFDSFTPAFSE
jgi:hypothetical protein